MKENKYDEAVFFEKYSQMDRSVKGLQGAGEWHQLQQMLPPFTYMSVLDLGCGYGWHCQYAKEHGAAEVVGVDISEKMLHQAQKIADPSITFIQSSIEDFSYTANTYDIVISSLTLHYIRDYDAVIKNIYHTLKPDGSFVFSVEHPVFTAEGSQDWLYDEQGEILTWPVDNYYIEGKRIATFLGERITKYHRTFTTYLQTLLHTGFEIIDVVEAQPSAEALATSIEMQNELRRPMMLLIHVKKRGEQ